MGTDFYARTYLGIPVSKGDFIQTGTKILTHCDHPEAHGNPFCPKCGTKAEHRTEKVTVEKWIPAVAAEAESEEWEDLSEDYTWEYFLSEYGLGGSLTLHSLNDGRYVRSRSEGHFILGMKVLEGGGWDRSSLDSVGFSELSEKAEEVRTEAAKYGIKGREVRLFTLLYVSN